MSLIAETTYEEFTNLFTNPNLLGDGTWAEVQRNLFSNPNLVGDGTWGEVRRNIFMNPGAVSATHRMGIFAGTDNTQASGVVDAVWSRSGKAFRTSWTTKVALTGSIGPSVATAALLPSTQYTVVWMFNPSHGTTFTTQNLGGGTTNASSGTVTTSPGVPAKMWATFTTGAAGEYPTNTRTDSAGLGLVNGSWIEVSEIDLYPGPYQPARTWGDGSNKPSSLVQPEDFRVRWLGVANSSESVMEIERVRLVSVVNCVAGVSKKAGKPAVRLIPIGPTEASTARVTIPLSGQSGGTVIATLHQDVPLTGTLNPYRGEIRTDTPISRSSKAPNEAGTYALKVSYGALTSDYRFNLFHGGGPGSGDVWWTDIGLYAGNYTGENFTGSAKPANIIQPEDFRVRWLGTVNNSESVLEIERVRGLSVNACIAGVSTKSGKPAVRLIPISSLVRDTFAQLPIPTAARASGTLVGTVHLVAPLVSQNPTDTRSRSVGAYSPNTRSSAPNLAGAYPLRQNFTGLTSDYLGRWYHGEAQGSGEVWWTDIGLFAGSYDGAAFSGSMAELYYKNVRVFPKWAGTPDNSPSYFRYYTNHQFDPKDIVTKWDRIGERRFETGVDRGMLYPTSGVGTPWNGITEIAEKPNGGEPTPYYIDGVKYLNWPLNEDFQASLKAYTYPREFEPHDGTYNTGKGLSVGHQPRRPFGLSYRTRVGNDIDGVEYGYKIHLVYNILASPSERPNATLSDDPSAIDFSWALTTTPVPLRGRKASAHLIIDSTRTDPYLLSVLEDILYGTEMANPRLPTGQEILNFFDEWITLLIIDHGDGTFTASGPDDVVYMTDSTMFEIDWASAIYISSDTYTLTSL